MERAEQQRTQAGAPNAAAALGGRVVEQRQQSAFEEDRGQKALQEEEEEARLRQEGDARQREEDAREREEARQRQEEEARQRVSEEVFDPYAVLGVPHGASRDDIGAAYQKAKLKYDPDQVAHLSAEVQAHYRAKAEAVDRAHQKLTE
jgi:DnaJ-domain-containing protein 1